MMESWLLSETADGKSAVVGNHTKKSEGELNMKQSVTSANTSINKNRMPAVYGKIQLVDGDRVLDYGCGRYTEHLYHHCKENLAGFFPFDPFNVPEWKNRLSREQLENRPATIGVMSNVLNVIDSDGAIREAISDALSLISHRGKLYITVYEGDKSGVGKYTSADSFQRNMKLKEYLPMLKGMGFDAVMERGTIVISGTHKF